MKKIQEIHKYNRCKVTLSNDITFIGKSIDIHTAQNDDGDDLGYEEVVVHVLDSNDKKINTVFLKEEDVEKVEELK